MKQYIGTKIVQAEPEDRYPGAIVDPLDQSIKPGYAVLYEDGYRSWSPKDVFEKAYHPIDGMTFGIAVEVLKRGGKVMRNGWNGKGMFVYYVPSASYPAMTDVAKESFGDMVKYNAYLAIKNINGTVSTWVPSINDVLAEDWQEVK